mgnify:CR=1 FL=1
MLRIETKDYDSPRTRRTIVNLEDGVCAGSVRVINEVTTSAKAIENQEIDTSFGYDYEDVSWEPNNLQ